MSSPISPKNGSAVLQEEKPTFSAHPARQDGDCHSPKRWISKKPMDKPKKHGRLLAIDPFQVGFTCFFFNLCCFVAKGAVFETYTSFPTSSNEPLN